MQTTGMGETLGDILRGAAERNPEGICIQFQQETYTFLRLNTEVNRLANALIGLGVTNGQKVALLIPNVPEFIVAYFACMKIGAVVVPINPKFQAEEIRFVLENSDSELLIISSESIVPVESMSTKPPALSQIVLLGRPGHRTGEGSCLRAIPDHGFHDFHGLTRRASAQEPSVTVGPDDAAGIYYTSGTTGAPKGVVLTHQKALAGMDAWIDGLGMSPRSRSLVIAPFFHIAFNAFVLSTFRAGGGTVILESFQLKVLFREIERTRPTFMFAIPSVYIMMVDYPQRKEYDLSSLESIVYGAAPMPVEVIHRVRDLFQGALYNAYGQTEMSSAISRLRPEYALSKAGSIGTPLKGIEVTILDSEDFPVPAGTVGEICCRGENMLKEYYKRPEQTAAKLRSGWLHTGDLGYLDSEGFLYISDRIDDIIISKGEKISPKEVEEVIYTHPDILDAAVVAMSDRVKGNIVVAFVVPRSKKEINVSSLRRYCRERLVGYKVPRHIEVVENIPRNPSGKVLRHELRKRAIPVSNAPVPK